MEQTNSFIDEIMGFDTTNLDVFQEKTSTSAVNANVYKPSINLSKAEDGHYRSRIRIIYNPYNIKRSIVHQATYAMKDQDGFFMVKSSLAEGNRDCPLFKSWKKLHFSGDDNKKAWGDKMYEKGESDWCLVQVLEDENQPEMVGQVRVMKLPRAIFTKMTAKMNPSAESKKEPVPVMDYLIGLPIDMDVTPGPDDPKQPSRRMREISYDLCEFDTDYAPIIKTDGTNLFTDNELESIDAFNEAKKKISKAKTEKAKTDAQKELEALKPTVRDLYQKALNYLKDEAKVVDLEQECAYQPWSDAVTERVNRWINAVANLIDPATVDVNETAAPEPAITTEFTTTSTANPIGDMLKEDLPF